MGVGSFFKGLVPYLSVAAETFGGPAGSIAASVLTKATGATVKPSDIATTIQNLSLSEDGRIKLDAAEKEYAETMAKMGYDSAEKMAEVTAADRANARQLQTQTRSRMPAILAGAAVVTLLFCIYLVAFRTLPPSGHDAIILLLGTVVAIVKDVYGYVFGSSAGSDRKTEIMAQNGNGH